MIEFLIGTWLYIGDDKRPARLADCPKEAHFTVSYNSGVLSHWQRFCYTPEQPPKPMPIKRKKRRK